MPIPKYDEMYRAFLDCLADGQLHKSKEVKDAVAGVFVRFRKRNGTEMLPSGKTAAFCITVTLGRRYERNELINVKKTETDRTGFVRYRKPVTPYRNR